MSRIQSAKSAFFNFFKKKPARIAVKILKTGMKILLTVFLIGAITASIVSCVVVAYVVTNFDGSEGLPDLENINLNQSSIIYVKNSKGEWVEEQRVQGANSIWKDLSEIPVHMQHAVVAIEDKRFYDHYGVDWKRTVYAVANLVFRLQDNEFGGSTITQQLIKNLTSDNVKLISRKVREIFRAVKMERKHASKDQILEAYLNILPLGGVSGVGAAANYFFGKEVSDLTIAESALIAGITQNPSKYNPYQNPDNAIRRQRIVLYEMYKNGFINAEEYKQAYNEELIFKNSMKTVGVQDYYNDLITEDVINGLMETYGYSQEYAERMFYYGGLKIYSAKVPEQQRKVSEIFENDKSFPPKIKGDKQDPQSGIIIIDYTGRVVATVGGRGEKTANRVLNRAVDSTRQPGSSIKPIAVYAPAIDLGLVTYSTIMPDKKITLKNNAKWPSNYNNARYWDMPVEEAIQRSLNTVPAQLMEMLTPQRSFDFLTNNLHFSTLVKSARLKDGIHTDIDYSPLTLGGLTYGVKCIEMAAAYQVFGNGGFYNKPYTFYYVEQEKNGVTEVLLQNQPTNQFALNEDTAYVMNRLLQRVINAKVATAYGLQIGSLETFGKTGTTDDNKDVYFVGGTPYYVGACWFGYDDNKELRSNQTSYAKSLWKKSMTALHAGLPKKTFDKKGNTIELEYCYATGKIATSGCPKKAVGVYKPEFVPDVCTAHGGTTSATGGSTTGTADTTTAAATTTGDTATTTIAAANE